MAVEVRLPAFEGPLDLLLHLIEKNQVDIYDIPIYEITQQYLACLDEWNKKNMEIASEFIVMAATLINIKVRMLLPVPKETEEEEDPREELVRRLLEYKRYKEAAAWFRERIPDPDRLWICRKKTQIVLPPQIPPIERLLGGVSLDSLFALYREALKGQKESVDPLRSTFKSVAKDAYTIDEKIHDLMQTLEALQSVSYYSLREKSRSRQEEITYFLAMLELNRSSMVYLRQEKEFADIIMSLRMAQEALSEPEEVPETEEEPKEKVIWLSEREEEPPSLPQEPVILPEEEPIEEQDTDPVPEGEPEYDDGEQAGDPGGDVRERGDTEPKKEYAASA